MHDRIIKSWRANFQGSSRVAVALAIMAIGLTLYVVATRNTLRTSIERNSASINYNAAKANYDRCTASIVGTQVSNDRAAALKAFLITAADTRDTQAQLQLKADPKQAGLNIAAAKYWKDDLAPRVIDIKLPDCTPLLETVVEAKSKLG